MTTGDDSKATGVQGCLHGRLGRGFDADDPAFVEQVLKLRAKRLAAPRATDDDQVPQGVAVLCFGIANEVFAVPLSDLSEVMPLGAWTPVPGLTRHLLGVTNVRGEIRPVLNLHDMLTLPEPDAKEPAHVVYLRRPGREVGLRVENLRRIRFIDTAELTVPHETANGLPQRFIAGISPDTLILLDARQILALDALQDLRADYRRAT
jgi:Chemotaxis signal transduction protein